MAAPKPMKSGDVLELAHNHMPSFLRQRERVGILDSWHRGEQNSSIYVPDGAQPEYEELVRKSPNSWAALIITAVVQNCELVGMRMPGSETNLKGWTSWQRNRMDARQPALYRAAGAHGLSFIRARPGKDRLTGETISRFSLRSAKNLAAFYDTDDDEWATVTLDCEPYYEQNLETYDGWNVTVSDDAYDYFVTCKGDGEDLKQWTFKTFEAHGARVTPVVQYAPNLDIDGRANSDLQGMLPLLARIDQDTFDRLIVQRFGAWKIRWIAGMVRPQGADTTAAEAQKIKLRMESLLISETNDTKFGTLDATDLAGFIAARDADLRDASALSQTPPHHMLGLSSNLQAESLAAAEAGLQRKSREHRTSFGESHEQLFRLDAHLRGDSAEMQAYEMQARWRDTESRSLEQAAMALGILATNLKVPVEMLWERVPGWTDTDVERAKKLAISGTSIDKILAEIEAELTQQPKQQPQEQLNGAAR